MNAAWQATLRLEYAREGARTVARHAHEGPLRVLKSLYPEGDGVCHHVIVHPPGGIVGGDALAVDVALGEGAHALLTTPGATRFYRSNGAPASQRVGVTLGAGARFEWLPMETLVHDGALASNELQVRVGSGASMIGWDLSSLGLPAADQAFTQGWFRQRIDIEGRWLERSTLDAADEGLLLSPLGLAGHAVFGVAWLLDDAENEAALTAALEAAREVRQEAVTTAVTRLGSGLVVARALAERVEPMMRWMRGVRGAWRRVAWQLEATEPRVWST